MIKLAFDAIALFCIVFITIYIWHRLLNKKMNYKSIKLYVTLLLLMIISYFAYYKINDFYRLIIITFSFILLFKYLFKEDIYVSLVTPIYTQLLTMISEVIYIIILSMFVDVNNKNLMSISWITLLSNFFNAIIEYIFIKFKFVKIIYNWILSITRKIKEFQLVFFLFAIVVVANVLTMVSYYKIEFKYFIIINTIVTIFCFSIIVYLFNQKNKYDKVYEKYNTTLNSLKDYESIIDKYKILNHENKNNLLSIRNMSKTNKEAKKFIDSIIENKIKDDKDVMMEVLNIPSGGLRGLFYSKILYMKQYNIKYSILVSKEIRESKIIKQIDDSTMLDVCKIIGVYIDNAIQEVKLLDDKEIIVSFYLDNKKIYIEVSNTYSKNININSIGITGYTTKGTNHGYGLTLVKKLVEDNSKLDILTKISKISFSQLLIIK